MRWLPLLLLAACTAEVIPQGAVNIEDTDALHAARQAWVDVGLPDTEGCAAPWWLRVDAQEIQRRCQLPSCTVGPQDNCVLACTDTRVAWWDKAQPDFEPYAMAHESFHAFSKCLLGTSDHDHANPRVWGDAINRMVSLLYPSAERAATGLPEVD